MHMRKIASGISGRKPETSLTIRTGLMFVIIVFISVVTFLGYYNTYMDKILYAERLSQMKEVTDQLFSGLDDITENQWDDAEIYSNYLEHEKPKTLNTLADFMSKQADLNKIKEKRSDIVAVDSLGRYYTQEGAQGALTEMRYLLDKPEHVSFVSKAMTKDETKMYFLSKLKEPVVIRNGSENITLLYYGVARNMEELNPYFNCDAYDGNNSVYVVNKNGEKLFSNTNDELLSGYNAYSVLEEMRYQHGCSFTEAKQELDDKGLAYSSAFFDGREYYYSLYQMKNAEWILLFLVPSEYVAVNTVQMIHMTARLVLILALVLVAVSVLIIFFLLKTKQRQAVEIEKRNNEKLAGLNRELEKAVKSAEDASRAKSNFLANMSHDIRTPMSVIVGITSLMDNEEGLSEKMHGYIHKIQASSRHLLGLINDILDMSRIEVSEINLNDESVSLADQVNQMDNIIRPQAEEKGQEFHISVNKIVHEYLICDGVRMRQIFINLLSNAVKYTPDGGCIKLEISEEECNLPGFARFCFEVTDNGYGMTKEFLAHIFDPFARAENSVTNKVQGTGLGMTITKNIVDLMGGEISVQSEEGRGSRFKVILNLKINEDIDYEATADSILLISTEATLVSNLKAAVSETPVALHCTDSLSESLGWLQKNSVEVILISGYLYDNSLKDMVSELRKAAGNVLIFCVEFTCGDKIHDTVSDSGADGLIQRPAFVSSLMHAIESISVKGENAEGDSVLSGMSFLCAEDNALNAEILESLLEMYGSSCRIYSDGAKLVEAFRSVRPGQYDVILMDVQMPNMNGLEATRAIRTSNNPLGKTIPVIAMTANAFAEDVQSCLEAGMNAHIAKPIDIAILERIIKGFK